VFLSDWESARWKSWAQYYFCTGLSHSTKIDISVWISHFGSYSYIYEGISSCDCTVFSQNISQSEILGQVTYRTWWKHIDPICPTFSCFPCSSLFPLDWQSITPCQPVFLTSVLAELIQEHMMRHSQPGALGFPKSWCRYLALYRIGRLHDSCLCSRVDKWSHLSS